MTGSAYKIIFLDIDNTLLSHRTNQIPEDALKAVKLLQQKHIMVFGCTGRHPLELQKLPVTRFHPDGWITTEGTWSFDRAGDISIYPAEQEDLIHLVREYDMDPFPIQILTKSRMYVTRYSKQYEEGMHAIHSPADPIGDIHDVFNETVLMFIPWTKNARMEKLRKGFRHVRAVNWNNYAWDCFSDEAGKDTGVKDVLQRCHLKKEEAIAIGDGFNDLPMFKQCGLRIAMGNGEDSLKKEADYVTSDIDKGGIWNALKNFHLI